MREKALHFGKKIISHELVSGSSLIFIGAIIANIFAFLFNLLLARSLSYVDYGEYMALLSLITLASIPAQSFVPVLVQYSSRFFNKNDTHSLREFYFQANRFLCIVGLGTIVFFIFASYPLGHFFHISSLATIIVAGFIVGVSYIAIVNSAFLQGLLRFDFLAATTIIGGLLKLLSGGLFIFIGWRVLGALGAVFFSFFIPFLFNFIPLANYISFYEKKRVKIPFKEIAIYALPTMVSVFCLSAFTSTDLLLVKHFFNGNDAGLYSGLSLIGRIIFYFTAPISTVMFPLVIKRYEEGRNFNRIFYLALFLVLTPSFFITLFYFIFPQLIISIFLGGKGYQAIAQYLGIYGVFLCVFSLINVLVTFFLSLKKTRVFVLLLLASISQAIFISIFHKNFWQVIFISLITALVLFLLLLLYYIKKYDHKKFTS